jgi:hypothetical protein
VWGVCVSVSLFSLQSAGRAVERLRIEVSGVGWVIVSRVVIGNDLQLMPLIVEIGLFCLFRFMFCG